MSFLNTKADYAYMRIYKTAIIDKNNKEAKKSSGSMH